jgi:NAD(P)-dependent dehydrogenase (short-subunit alcohol dehydrogenase family)
MAFPSPVKTFHTDTYPAINPTSPRLSTVGKNIVITGGGSGIGLQITTSFAKSGASSISIFGRREKMLVDTKAKLEKEYPKTKIYTYAADIVDKAALDKAFDSIKATVGIVDVLVANAGYLPTLTPIAKADINEWYNGFEVNVKGSFNLVTAFMPVASKNAAIINITSGIVHLATAPGYSGYHTSKLAGTKLFDYVHYEYPELFVLSIHPGVLKTDMAAKAGEQGWPYDEGEFWVLYIDFNGLTKI